METTLLEDLDWDEAERLMPDGPPWPSDDAEEPDLTDLVAPPVE